jgi:protein TonB
VALFSIDEQGQPTDIKVVESSEPNAFDKAAIRALTRWKYKAKIVNGKPRKKS